MFVESYRLRTLTSREKQKASKLATTRGAFAPMDKKKAKKLKKKFEKLDEKEQMYPEMCQKKGPLGMECTWDANHKEEKCKYLF